MRVRVLDDDAANAQPGHRRRGGRHRLRLRAWLLGANIPAPWSSGRLRADPPVHPETLTIDDCPPTWVPWRRPRRYLTRRYST